MAIVFFDVEASKLKETEELVEKLGGKLYHGGAVPVTLATQADDVLDTILSDLGFTSEDLADGTVRKPKTAVQSFLDDITADDPDNEVTNMQTLLQAIRLKLGEWRADSDRLKLLGDPLSPQDVAKIEALDRRAQQFHGELATLFSWDGSFGSK